MRTVLVVVTRQIGDVLLTTPLVHDAKRLWPHASIDVLGFAGTLGMLDGNPDVRQRIEIPSRGGAGLLRKLWRRYDLALVADAGDRAHLIGFAAARTRSGIVPAKSGSNWWKRALLKHAVVSAGDLGETHVVVEKLALLDPWRASAAGEARLVAPAGLPLPPKLASRLRPRYVVMHAPSMWPYKQWPVAHFRELAQRLQDSGLQVVLTGGPSDREVIAQVIDADHLHADRLIDAGVLAFGQLATLLQGAALYIGPDTSVSHLAAAAGARVLAIFGPTNPQRWSPWPGATEPAFARRSPAQSIGNITIVQASLPCVPCGRAGCEDHRMSRTDCLPAIAPLAVFAEAMRLLA